jgi:hypothetical protein
MSSPTDALADAIRGAGVKRKIMNKSVFIEAKL